MPDASGTPSTNYEFPTYNTAVDNPSGDGFNTFVADIDTKLAAVTTLLGAVARVQVKDTGSIVGTRRGINFIEGSNITLTIADDSGNEEVDITIAGADQSSPAAPSGSILAYGGSSAPSGWLLCDGSAVSRTTYADLFTAISTAYGVGDGSTTFNVPDLQGRVPVGLGTHADVNALADSDGLAVSSRTPKHTHTVSVNQNGGADIPPQGTSGNTYAASSSGTAASNGGAYLTVNYIIKT